MSTWKFLAFVLIFVVAAGWFLSALIKDSSVPLKNPCREGYVRVIGTNGHSGIQVCVQGYIP